MLAAYRLSTNVGAQGRGSTTSIVDSLAHLEASGGMTRVTLSRHLGGLPNRSALSTLRRAGVQAEWAMGSFVQASHEKLTLISTPEGSQLFAGSIDPWTPRWDTTDHIFEVGNRYGAHLAPSHDVGLKLSIPEPSLDVARTPIRAVLEAFESPSVKVILRDNEDPNGLLGHVEDQLSAAEHNIYIEDQYFLPRISLPSQGRALLEVLRERVAAGVNLTVVLPGPSGPFAPRQAIESRSAAMVSSLLEGLPPAAGSVRIFGRQSVQTNGSEAKRRRLYVHSKVIITDSRAATIGSANFTSRSMLHDTESAVSLTDPSVVAELERRLVDDLTGGRHSSVSSLPQLDLTLAEVTGLVDLSRRRAYRFWQLGEVAFKRLADPNGCR